MIREKPKILLGLAAIFFLMFLLTGCETLRRKFTRQKKSQKVQEVMIVSPRDYSAHPFPSDVLYKQYFVYWKSWNQELVSSLNDRAPDIKVIDCAEQAIANLKKMATYLNDPKAKELNIYIKQTEDIKSGVLEARGLPPAQANNLRYKSERILSSVNRKFDLTKMKPYLK
jgi:hypothetical protein